MSNTLSARAFFLSWLLMSFAIPADAAPQEARATDIPGCTSFVDAAAPANGNGSPPQPWQTMSQAVTAAENGAVICVAEGEYNEELKPGTKSFTLAGGFQRNANFAVRDSAKYISKAQGKGGTFFRIEDPGPSGDQLTAIDGFEITGYKQAIVRDYYEPQRFDVTNNFIHDNKCADDALVGAGFALNNVSGIISGNVIRNNSCGRGGAGFLNDTTNKNSVIVDNNLIDGNEGIEASAHGGGLYLFGNTLRVSNNVITNNRVTMWGGGLYIGAFTPGNQPTTATMSNNIIRGNKAGDSGGGFFCDDGATCITYNDVYDHNCGANILVDGGSNGSGPTTSVFDHITNVFALDVDCKTPGAGVFVDTYEVVGPDSHTFTNSIFWGNGAERDIETACGSRCNEVKVSVDSSLVQTAYKDGTIKVVFGSQNVAPEDPLFAFPESGDFRLGPLSPAAGKGALMNEEASAQSAAPQAPAATPQAVVEPQKEQPAKEFAGDVSASAIAVRRGEKFFTFDEKFNRFYTDPDWKPSKIVYVAPTGSGDGSARQQPSDAKAAMGSVQPGTQVIFLPGSYDGGFEFTQETGGTYDDPVVLSGELDENGKPTAKINCAVGNRKTCFNLEGGNYVAIKGFELVGGTYGVRVVGLGYDASQHSRGIAVLGNTGHGQDKDPFFSGQSDWNVWEGNLGFDAGKGDGHGIYISNGSDWNIVRRNETHSNASSGFQINADPNSTCGEDGVAFTDPKCDAYAGESDGGRGASDYFLVENNYFHHDDVGGNFTSVRRSIIRNNVFGMQIRHNTSFWQETDNPKLGSSDNQILHNLFIATQKQGAQFINNSVRNTFANNVILGVQVKGNQLVADPNAVLMEIDESGRDNKFVSNFYAAGKFEGREIGAEEFSSPELRADWFTSLPVKPEDDVKGFTPTASSAFLNRGKIIDDAKTDRLGKTRADPTDLGPFEGQ